MTRLTAKQRTDVTEFMGKMEAVLKLAHANFPRSTDVRIGIASPSIAQAEIVAPWYLFQNMIDLARATLEDH